VAAAGVGLWHIPAVLAEDAIVIDGQDAADEGGSGMPSSNPRVKSILAAHPDQFVVICVAGCSGKPRPVQFLPRPLKGRTAEFVPSAASPEREGNGAGSRRTMAPGDSNDVVCVAGCSGRPGEVVQRIPDLPPRAIAPKAPKEKASEAAAPVKPETPEQRDEPLDILP